MYVCCLIWNTNAAACSFKEKPRTPHCWWSCCSQAFAYPHSTCLSVWKQRTARVQTQRYWATNQMWPSWSEQTFVRYAREEPSLGRVRVAVVSRDDERLALIFEQSALASLSAEALLFLGAGEASPVTPVAKKLQLLSMRRFRRFCSLTDVTARLAWGQERELPRRKHRCDVK